MAMITMAPPPSPTIIPSWTSVRGLYHFGEIGGGAGVAVGAVDGTGVATQWPTSARSRRTIVFIGVIGESLECEVSSVC